MAPTVSVIIPAYNASKHLAETIDTVLAQSFQDFEVIIINDGSADSTLDIAASYKQKDSRIRVISQHNQGVSRSRNNGIKQACGELMAFLDADDKWLLTHLEHHVNHFKAKSSLAVSFGRVLFVKPDGESTHVVSKPPLRNIKPYHFFYENPTITSSNLIVRKAVFYHVGFFDESMSYSEDQEWCLRVLSHKQWQIEGLDQILIHYRATEDGLSSNLEFMEQGWEVLASKARSSFPDLVEEHYSKAKATYLRYLARKAIRLKLSPDIAVNFIVRALHTDWNIIFAEPKRTVGTILLAYAHCTLDTFKIIPFQKLNTKNDL